MKRKNEPSLKSTDINELNDFELIKFTFGRDSFFRDYQLLHPSINKDEAINRVYSVIFTNNIKDICQEFRICFKAAIQTKVRQSYYFNLYIIDLIERFYSDFVYYQNKEETVLDRFLSEKVPDSVSYQWVLFARVLNPYQRYLMFEYLALGYSLEDLARRRYCTSRTIDNHIKQILDLFGF